MPSLCGGRFEVFGPHDLSPCFQSILFAIPALIFSIVAATLIRKALSPPCAYVVEGGKLWLTPLVGIRLAVCCILAVMAMLDLLIHMYHEIWYLALAFHSLLQLFAWALAAYHVLLDMRQLIVVEWPVRAFWILETILTIKSMESALVRTEPELPLITIFYAVQLCFNITVLVSAYKARSPPWDLSTQWWSVECRDACATERGLMQNHSWTHRTDDKIHQAFLQRQAEISMSQSMSSMSYLATNRSPVSMLCGCPCLRRNDKVVPSDESIMGPAAKLRTLGSPKLGNGSPQPTAKSNPLAERLLDSELGSGSKAQSEETTAQEQASIRNTWLAQSPSSFLGLGRGTSSTTVTGRSGPLSAAVHSFHVHGRKRPNYTLSSVWGLAYFAVYKIVVKWSRDEVWTVTRRFSDFELLLRILKEEGREVTVDEFGFAVNPAVGRTEPSFLARRLVALNAALQVLVSNRSVRSSPTFISFLTTNKVTSAANFNTRLTVEDFDLLAVIGKGSFGKVMQVRKKDTGKIYAMKVLKKRMLGKPSAIIHTKTERAVLAKIDHPFIASLRYAFQTKNKLFLVVDFFNGGELFFHLNKGRFTEDRAKFCIAELVLALDCLHSFDIAYRDLKPENILLDSDGHIRLVDFGLSKEEVGEGPRTHTFCGTAQYLAPEIILGQPYGKTVDWWGVGTLLYELLTSHPPFHHKHIKRLYDQILHAPLRFPNYISESAQDLITSLLQRDPALRLGLKGAEEVKRHPFFDDIDWEMLLRKEVLAPFRPSEGELGNVWEQFKQEPPQNTPLVESVELQDFSHFTYVQDEEEDAFGGNKEVGFGERRGSGSMLGRGPNRSSRGFTSSSRRTNSHSPARVGPALGDFAHSLSKYSPRATATSGLSARATITHTLPHTFIGDDPNEEDDVLHEEEDRNGVPQQQQTGKIKSIGSKPKHQTEDVDYLDLLGFPNPDLDQHEDE